MNKESQVVFLVGMPGCGKSYLGAEAARLAKVDFVDLDKAIAETTQNSISELFESLGEVGFRNIEATVLRNLLPHSTSRLIVATGGGTPCFHNNMEWMNENGITVWMRCDLELLEERLVSEYESRPLFANSAQTLKAQIENLWQKRHEFYAQSRVEISIDKGLRPDLFTNRLLLSTFDKRQ